MHICDGLDERQAETRARCGSARLEANESLQHPCSVGLRNARPAVAHDELRRRAPGLCGHADMGTTPRMANGVFDQIGERLREEVTIAPDMQPRGDRSLDVLPGLLRVGAVCGGYCFEHIGKI